MRDISKDPELHSYLSEVKTNKFRSTIDDMVTSNDLEIVYEMGVTPQLVDEPEWCIFSVDALKQVFGQNKSFEGEMIVDFKVNFAYKIKEQGNRINPDFLFGVLLIAYYDFIKQYAEKAKGTYAEKYKLNIPEYKYFEKDIRAVIIGQGISKQ